MHQYPVGDHCRTDGRGDAMRQAEGWARSIATLLLMALFAGCVHKAPGLPAGRPAPIVNTDRPGTLSQ